MDKGGREGILREGLDLGKEMCSLLCEVITGKLSALVCGAKEGALPVLCPLPGKPCFSTSSIVAPSATSSDCSFFLF